jgi:hypothetical protein
MIPEELCKLELDIFAFDLEFELLVIGVVAHRSQLFVSRRNFSICSSLDDGCGN